MTSTNETAQIEWVDIELVEEPLHLLRTADTGSPAFLATLESMRADGFWASKPLDVSADDSASSRIYILNDGRQRLECARILKIRRVPVVVLDKPLTEEQRLERSIVAQATGVPTKPVEYARGLAKLVELNKGITNTDLAKRLRKSPAWVAQMLRLGKLEGPASDLVDANRIPLANAQGLVEIQRAGIIVTKDTLEKAEREGVDAFAETASAIIAEHRSTKPKKREPVAKLRPVADVKAELDRAMNDPNAHPAFVEALRWTLRKDAVSAAAEGIEPATPKPLTETVATNPGLSPETEAKLVEELKMLRATGVKVMPYTPDTGVEIIPTLDIATLVHWALGAGADPGDLPPELHEFIATVDAEVVRAVEIIGLPVLVKKFGTTVSRWQKGKSALAFAQRKAIREMLADPIYRNLINKKESN